MRCYKPAGRSIYRVKVPSRNHGWRSCSTGTIDKNTAKKMAAMIDDLGPGGARAWDMLDEIGESLSLPMVWDLWVAVGRDVDGLRELVFDIDLARYHDRWYSSVLLRASAVTADHYSVSVRSLFEANGELYRSKLTAGRIMDLLSNLTMRRGGQDVPVQTGTARRYHAAISSFCQYLIKIGVLTLNPMDGVPTPSAGKPRDRFLETHEVLELVDSLPEPYRTIAALMAGTGIELSVALLLCRADIDVYTMEIRARGTKTLGYRDRFCRVATWAWPYVELFIRDLQPRDLLFPGITRRNVADSTKAACAAIEIRDYTPRDHRHTWAVRAVSSGMPIELVARQLGHKDGVLCLQVYARWVPRQDERDKWERIAATKDDVDLAREKTGTTSGTTAS